MSNVDKSTLLFEIQDRDHPRKKKKRYRPSAPCKLEGCNGWAWAQGYCDPHYQKLKREGHIKKQRVMKDDIARFRTKYKVNSATGCWEWIGSIHPKGYAMMGITVDGKPKSIRANRFSYEEFIGPIPEGMMVLHKCDNRRCVRPNCLFLGTGEDNMRDCAAKGRTAGQQGKSGPKVTKAMALNIRVMYARGHHSLRLLAAIYRLEEETVRKIAKGQSHLKA